MDAGTQVYRAHICVHPGEYWIDTGIVTDIACDGTPMVKMQCGVLISLADRWYATKVEAKSDAAAQIARQIGTVQSRLDALREEILHEHLCTEEVIA